MALANMKVFNDYMYTSATETIQQQIELFNAATRGAIVLRNDDPDGDFDYETFFQSISGIVTNRDAYTQSDLTPVDLAMGEMISVKIGGGTKAVRYQPQQFDWINRNQEEAGMVFGEQVAAGIMQYMLNSGISAAVGAIGANTTLVHTATAGTKANLTSLNAGARLFGDRASRIAAWVMHSKSLHDLYDQSLTNANRLFTFGDIQVFDDGFGRPLVMTDSPALVNTTPTPDTYTQLGLVPGAILVEDNRDYRAYADENMLKANTEHYLKAEFSFNLGLKGYAWDTASGGKSPNDTAIGTGTNWDKYATDNKDTMGVMVVTE